MQILTTTTVQPQTHCLIYGPAKSGKTRLSRTAPNPLILDADDGLASVRDDGLPYIPIRTYKDFEDALRFVTQSAEAKQYATIIVDDLTEVAELFLVMEKPNHKNLMQAYGRLNDETMAIIRALRGIREQTIVFNCKQDRIKDELTGGLLWAPAFPGKAVAPMLPYLVGEVYHMEAWRDPNTGTVHETLRTKRDPNNTIEAGSRSGALAEIEFANLSNIFAKIQAKQAA